MNAVVYTDGSGTTGGPAGIAYVGIVQTETMDVDIEGSMPLKNATNQQAEILAAAYALTDLTPCESVILYSDSEYVVKGASGWISGWIRRDWRTASGSPVKNQPHWKRLLAAIERHKMVEFRWVRGHAGHPENERADKLAGEARQLARDHALMEGLA